jgi:hypothetical protein
MIKDRSVTANFVEVVPEGEGIVEGEGTVEGTPEGTIEGEGIPEGEGTVEGTPEGTPEGTVEGEGTPEGTIEGTTEGSQEGEIPSEHSADKNKDHKIDLGELLRVIQIFNSGGYHCADLLIRQKMGISRI